MDVIARRFVVNYFKGNQLCANNNLQARLSTGYGQSFSTWQQWFPFSKNAITFINYPCPIVWSISLRQRLPSISAETGSVQYLSDSINMLEISETSAGTRTLSLEFAAYSQTNSFYLTYYLLYYPDDYQYFCFVMLLVSMEVQLGTNFSRVKESNLLLLFEKQRAKWTFIELNAKGECKKVSHIKIDSSSQSFY